MTNIYWPVYKNLESEVTKLTYAIHIDDNQLSVYSPLISDLILRASAEIESISKELYKANGGVKTEKIKYDSDALNHLNALWKLEKKVVLVSSINCFQSKRALVPFTKNEESAFHKKQTYSWNNSYQNLKHDRANSLPFGSLKYLFDIMAALFVLNLYYKDDVYSLKKDSEAVTFSTNMGSELFAIKLHKWLQYDEAHSYAKRDDFDECIYLTRYTDDSLEKHRKANGEMLTTLDQSFSQHTKLLEYQKANKNEDIKDIGVIRKVLGGKEFQGNIQIAFSKVADVFNNTQYEAILNKGGL